MRITKKMLAKRRRSKSGAIMKPKIFANIVAKAKRKGLSTERAKKIAGAAYWRTLKAKTRRKKK